MSVPSLNLARIDLERQPNPVTEPETFTWHSRPRDNAAYANLREWYGTEWANRIFGSIGFGHDVEDSWKGVRPLGRGGFGWAALYERQIEGQVVDQVVIKDTNDDYYRIGQVDRIVPTEAFLMEQLNQWNNPNIVRLRSFKRYLSPSGYHRRHRFYLEYCPHGDLWTLRFRYRHFSRFFPESFMWHTLHSLANALVDLRNRPYISPGQAGQEDPDPAAEIIHFDIKEPNIFLGDPPPMQNGQWRDAEHAFPTVKLGDYGLSQITHPGDSNPSPAWLLGTREIQPPEQDDLYPKSQYVNVLNDWFPPWQNKPWRGFERMDEKHNVFAIAQVVLSLMTHENFRTRVVYRMGLYQEKDGHFIDRINTLRGSIEKPGKKLGPRQNAEEPGEYSDELRRLIRDCLHPDPRRRPTASELEAATRAGLDRTLHIEGDNYRTYRQGSKNAGRRYKRNPDPHKLYFKGNEMTDMAPGQLYYYPWRKQKYIGPRRFFEEYGWTDDAHELIGLREGALLRERGLPNAPIVFPKLRWLPPPFAAAADETETIDGHSFYLMRKRRNDRHRTRFERTTRPPGYYDIYEDTADGGVQGILMEPENDNHREKDVWVAPHTEHGPWDHEYHQTLAAEAIATWSPPVTCLSCLSHRHRDHECPFPPDLHEVIKVQRIRHRDDANPYTDEQLFYDFLPPDDAQEAEQAARQRDIERARALADAHDLEPYLEGREHCRVV